MAKNLLVDWMNQNKQGRANVQAALANKTSATNANTVTTPNLLTRPTVNGTNLNLQKAQQPVQTRLNNLNNQTLPVQSTQWIVSNNPAFSNWQLINQNQTSRFIWFQQQPQYENTTIGSTAPQAKNMGKMLNGRYIYIPTFENQATKSNAQEEKRYKEDENLVKKFHYAVKNHNWQMTAADIRKEFPEWIWMENAALELQADIAPLVQQGQFANMDQISQYYGELLQAKNLNNIEDVKKQAEDKNKNFQLFNENLDKVLKSNWDTLSANWMKYVQDARLIRDTVEEAKRRWVVWGANDYEIWKYLAKNSPELQKAMKEMGSLELTNGDKAKLWLKNDNLFKQANQAALSLIRDEFGLYDETEADYWEVETGIKAREKLESDFWNQVWMKISTEIGVPLDSLEKFAYRTYKDMENMYLEKGADFAKDYIAKKLKSEFNLTDEQTNKVKEAFDTATSPSIQEKINTNKQNVLDYQDIVSKEYERRKNQNLDQDIENFYNNRSMTSMLLNWDLKWFAYKSSWEAAQNAEMPLLVAIWAVAPEVVLPLMAMDSYARESQESFEELMNAQEKAGITGEEAYDNAQKLSAVVWVASATVELALEKVLGWVETTASTAFHDLLMKDVTERATKMVAERWLMDLLKQWAITQFRSSLEEWLEEVVQQAIHNKALQKYDPDQKITEWMLQSFEWGFFNWMNLLGWGWDVLNNVDVNAVKQWASNMVDNATTKARNIVDNVQQSVNNWVNNVRNLANRIEIAPWKIGETIDSMRNKVTSQGGKGNTQQQWQQTQLNTTSENQNNINWENNTENGGWSQPKKWVIGKALSWIGKAYDSTVWKAIDTVAEKWAEAITSTSTPQDKLFQAVSPTLNKLTNKRGNYEQKRQNADRTNELIVEYGHTPTNSTEYYDALIKTKNALWKNEIQRWLDEHKYTTISSKELTDAVRDEMQEDARFPLETNKSDLAKLNKELASLDRQGELTLEQLEAIKQQINAKLNYGKNAEAGEIYEKWLRAMNTKISQIEDQLIAKLPWEFTKFKKDYGALKDMEEDVLKMMLKDMKKKDGGGLTQNMWRLAWVGKLLSSPLEWTMQIIFWETIWKAKETNFLIQKGFEDLRNQYKWEKRH